MAASLTPPLRCATVASPNSARTKLPGITMYNLFRPGVLAVFVAVVCAAAAPHAASQTMTLRLAQSTPMLWPQTRIANGAGLWEKHGLTVNQTLFATGREAMQALLGGQADVAEVAPTPLDRKS